MSYCSNCGTFTPLDVKYCNQCLNLFIQEIWASIKPSKIKGINVNDLFPVKIIEVMHDFLLKDINELLQCIASELWTATMVMNARILESELKLHIEFDLKDNPPENIGGCIIILRNHGYNESFLDQLEDLRELRNDAMHGEKRFSPDISLDTSRKVLSLIMWIYNLV